MLAIFRNRNLTFLLSASAISLAGDMVLFVALPFWVFQLTQSAMATGVMFAALTIPQLVFSPIAGVFVDRLDRKHLMIVSDLLRAALVLCYFIVNTADQVWIIYLLAFCESAVSQFFRPAVNSVVPTLVSNQEELTRANAGLGATFAIGQLAGPALGGALVVAFGPHAAALFDAGTYILSALLLAAMTIPAHTKAATALTGVGQAVGAILHEMAVGVRVVLGRSSLRVVFASVGILFLSQGIINVLLIVMVDEMWHAGAQELGWLISAQGIGGIIGTVVVGAIAGRVSPRALILGGGLIAGALFLAIVNQPSVYVAMALLAFAGMFIVAFDIGLTTLLQMGSDDENRGRVSGLMQTTMALAQLISIGLTSLLADALGASILLNIAGVLTILGGLVAIFAPRTNPATTPVNVTAQPAE